MHRHSIARTLITSLKKGAIQLAGYFLMGNFFSTMWSRLIALLSKEKFEYFQIYETKTKYTKYK